MQYTPWSMKNSTNIRTGRHCVFNMHVHLVFVTKYRRNVFTKKSLNILAIIFEDVCSQFEATLVEFDGERDHVHLLVQYPPKLALSKLVNSLKGVSSRLLRKHVKEIQQYYWKGVLWSPSYFASSCGGGSIEIIKEYIQNQQSPS
jgi:putative transposase